PENTNQFAQVNYETFVTQRGQKRTLTLSDGSTIRLNYETEFKAPRHFEEGQRVVYLTGHAHFDVARDTERPFIIYTEDSKTQVLGTSFDINTKEEGTTEIIVTSGQVAFSDKDNINEQVMLTVNDRAVLNSIGSIGQSTVDAETLTAWKDNRLVFDDALLSEIIEVLQPWYDVEITVNNPNQLQKAYNFSFDNPSLELLLEQMSFMGKFEYQMEGKQVIID
ncbi:MAG: FecR domain-containing protein, partial [Bacteroidota bacterium]